MTVARKDNNIKVNVTLLEAKNITLERERIEREILPLGDTQVEVELALVPISELRFDRTNPRVAFRLKSHNEHNPTQERLQEILWEDDEVKALKNSIQLYGGLIEAIIVQNDGTVLEGNCRLACLRRLQAEAHEKDASDTQWDRVKARILAPGIDRAKIDALLGELHFAGKNKWSAFEQAAHIYRMLDSGNESVEDLATRYRQSKSYIIAKKRAYALMSDKFVPMIEKAKANGTLKVEALKQEKKGADGYWSWFEELYKTCSPTPEGRSAAKKAHGYVYDGAELEQKFCEWMIEDKLPKAEQVRKLQKILSNPDAMAVFEQAGEDGGIEQAVKFVAEDNPALNSKLWKQVQSTAELLGSFPLDELQELRDGDAAKSKIFDELAKAVDRIRTEATKL